VESIDFVEILYPTVSHGILGARVDPPRLTPRRVKCELCAKIVLYSLGTETICVKARGRYPARTYPTYMWGILSHDQVNRLLAMKCNNCMGGEYIYIIIG
jgi:hypothetical protein